MAGEKSDGVYYITTPIYYVNALPHIGHSYTTVAADVVARYQRLRGQRVLFATGTDEHGQKVFRTAQDQGIEPQALVDRIAEAYKDAWRRLHIQYDVFIRTTEPRHMQVVQHVFAKLRDQGDIYLGTYEGWYCVACETYYREDELIEGKCPDCGRPVERVSQPAYFFRTSKYADRLLQHIHENPNFILPEARRNEVVSFIKRGLRDACVSRRRCDWDIPVPGDPDQSIYVWFDALLNYLTVAGYLHEPERFGSTWPPDLQLMGKDILPRFHATLWPAILMALGLELPKRLFAHGWWVTDTGDKISKSKGNIIDPLAVADEVAEYSGCSKDVAVDAVRYYMLREVTFGLDGSFSVESLLERFNADLANDLGNLLNRSLPLVVRYQGGEVVEPGPGAGALADEIAAMRRAYEQAMEVCDFRRALEAVWGLLAAANKMLDQRAPWQLYRQGKTVELAAVLYDVVDAIRCVAIAVHPFMPTVADELWRRIGLSPADNPMAWADVEAGKLPAGVRVDPGEPMFPRVDIEALKKQREREEAAAAQAEEEAKKPKLVSFRQFQQLDLRVGKVVSAERVEGTDKLLKLVVDLGEEKPRQVVAGLAQRFQPEELVGKLVVVVANLEPARIRGVLSEGMILAAGEDEPVALVTLDRPCEPGEKVR